MWTAAAGSWLVLQVPGWWQTKQRLLCPPCYPVLQKMINIKHQISLTPLLTEFSPWDFEGKQHLPSRASQHMEKATCEDTWELPKVSWPKMHLSWLHTTSHSSDPVRAHSSESLSHTGTDRSRIHSVKALGALPFQPPPGGVGRSLGASEWQLAHQRAEMESLF